MGERTFFIMMWILNNVLWALIYMETKKHIKFLRRRVDYWYNECAKYNPGCQEYTPDTRSRSGKEEGE